MDPREFEPFRRNGHVTSPQMLLEMFSIEQDTFGGRCFLAVVWWMWAGRSFAEAKGLLMERLHCPAVAVNAGLKRTAQPILDTDRATLQALGLWLTERSVFALCHATLKAMGGTGAGVAEV